MTRLVRRLIAATGLFALLAAVGPAPADATVLIGLQQDADPISTVASGTGLTVFSGAFGQFESVTVFGFGQPSVVPPLLLQGGAGVGNSAGSSNAGTLSIYITSTGNLAPLTVADFTAGFANVDLTPGWTETFEAYVDPGNGVYALTTLLGSATFTTVDTEVDTATATTGAGPFSVTAVLRLTAPSTGGATSSVGLNAEEATAVVPAPAALVLLGSGLVAFAFTRRDR